MNRIAPTLAVLAAACLAPAAHAFDLYEAWAAARQYDANFAAQKAERDAGLQKREQGLAGLLPQVGVGASYTRSNDIEPVKTSPSGSYGSHGWQASLSQPLFDVGAWTGYQKGKLASRLADTRFDAATQTLILDVARAYFGVLLSQDTVASVQAAKKAFAKQLEQAKKSFDVGTSTILDTYEAQARFNAASAREIAALSELEVRRNALKTLTGLDAQAIAPLKGKVALAPPTPDKVEPWIERALAQNPAVAAAAQQLALAEQDLTASRGQHLPKLSLSAAYQDRTTNNPNAVLQQVNDSRGSSVGVTLSMPIYAGGGINSRVAESVALREQASETLEATRRKVRENVRAAFLGVANGAALVDANERLLVSAKNQLDATRLGREVGVRTILDLLSAEQAYYEAERTLAESRYNYLTAQLQLALAAGELSETTLRGVNRYF
ncbi:TolC family outer membrane protein [Crenobacter intestini]|uniref:Type I secretion system n=1 Tax=Crenobacter intestini TaxID=2563443 RepID=A0A4T0V019_9NEIS|nr:TolC family outer membrane protein [Crenobacter intestini]TIC84768.1 type I secretion system [Crenobacter intestini]